MDAFGAIHAAVNNAGNVRDRSFLKMSDEEFDSVVQVHVYGTFRVAQEAALKMRDQGSGGSIVNTSSMAGRDPFPGSGHYSAAKAGVSMLTKTLALELGPQKIRVNAILPGFVPTLVIAKIVFFPFRQPLA